MTRSVPKTLNAPLPLQSCIVEHIALWCLSAPTEQLLCKYNSLGTHEGVTTQASCKIRSTACPAHRCGCRVKYLSSESTAQQTGKSHGFDTELRGCIKTNITPCHSLALSFLGWHSGVALRVDFMGFLGLCHRLWLNLWLDLCLRLEQLGRRLPGISFICLVLQRS